VPQLTAEGRRRRLAVPGGQRRPLGAGGEVRSTAWGGSAGGVALGSRGRTLLGAGRPEREGSAFVQTYSFFGTAPGRPERAEAADGQVPDIKSAVTSRRGAVGRRERLRRDAPRRARHQGGRLDRRRQDPRGVLQDRHLRRPAQDLCAALCAGAGTTPSPRTTTSGRSSSTNQILPWGMKK